MAWGGWVPNMSGTSVVPQKKEKLDRDKDLENIMGNLMITEFQLGRLIEMLWNHVSVGGDSSKFMEKHPTKNIWMDVEIKVTEHKDPEEKKKEDAELEKAYESVGP